jgi:hypothetical protein
MSPKHYDESGYVLGLDLLTHLVLTACFAHATPYYYQKDEWSSMIDMTDKGPVRFLEKQIEKYDRTKNNLETMATQTPNICKWIGNEDIDKKLSNEFWNNPAITEKQKSCLIKFRT